MVWLFRKFHMRDTIKILLLLGVSFLFVSLEATLKSYLPVSGLLAVMALGGTILKKNDGLAKRISNKYAKLWVAAELLLFVLVGAAVDIGYIANAGMMAVCLILVALIFRMVGVFICLLKTELNIQERLFTAVSHRRQRCRLPSVGYRCLLGWMPVISF